LKIFNILNTVFKRIKTNATATNIIIVGVISVVVKVFGFFKEVVIASEFGLSELLDTFFIALLIPGFVNEVFLNAFKAVFIPNYIAEKKVNDNIGPFQSISFIITLITALVFMLVAYLITDVFLELFFSGHEAVYYQLIKLQFYYLLPCIIFWGFSSLLSGLLNIYDEFTYSTLFPIITSIFMLVCLFFYKDTLGEGVLAVGMLLGSIGQFLFLLFIALKKGIIKIAKPDFSSKNAKTMFKQVPAKVSSGFLTGLIPVTDQYFAAQLVVGSIAALNFGIKIPAFFSTILIIALGNVLLPYFSKLTLDSPKEAFKNLYQIIKWTFIVLLTMMIITSLFSSEIVSILFERNNFSPEDTNIVSQIQIVFLIGVPFAICGNLFVKFLTSINKNAFMAYVSLGAMILNIILDFVFMKFYGILGIAICTTIIQIIKIVVFYYYTDKQKRIMIIK
jgi:putative peptidoglycan lipid II flippase